jgi:3,4-dihydroxy-2-butanone 4-phosphate synthase
MTISKIEEAVASMSRGEMVIVVDSPDRENEGDIVIAGEAITPAAIAFMMKHARGLICVSMQGNRLDQLEIPLMLERNSESMQTAFTVSVDYLPGTTTGISASDRASTISGLLDPAATPAQFARPGHIFPLRAHPDGVFGRQGHTEAAVDLARLAGFAPCGVICEIANDDGSMARLPDLEQFARVHGLCIVTIEDLIAYRRRNDEIAWRRNKVLLSVTREYSHHDSRYVAQN